MWPLKSIDGGPRGPRASGRTLLCAAWLAASALAAWAQPGGAAGTAALREKDVRRAEQVLAKLRLLDEAAAAGDGAAAFGRLAAKFYPGLRITVADMRESDLKTDLDTAVFLHEELGRAWAAAGAAAADCGRERPDIYLPLCLGLRGPTARQLLLSKARLHARWAGAVVRDYRKEPDADTAADLSAQRAARAADLVIAGRVLEALRPLAGAAALSPACADEGGCGRTSRVSSERLEGVFADALASSVALLHWLPRGPAFYHFSRARAGYRDGLFWYRKAQRSAKLVVSAHSFERDELKELGLDAERVGSSALANWKAAARLTGAAEQQILPRPRE